jgi:hypothetical protein
MMASRLPRTGVIIMRDEIEKRIGYFEHEDLWKAIGKRVVSDSGAKQAITNAIASEAETWRSSYNRDEREFTIKFRATSGQTVLDQWKFCTYHIILDVVNVIIKDRTAAMDNVLPEDVTVKFGTEALPKNMTFGKLVDNRAFGICSGRPRPKVHNQ